jgi:hypothetical protein
MAAVAPGSYLALSHVASDIEPEAAAGKAPQPGGVPEGRLPQL